MILWLTLCFTPLVGIFLYVAALTQPLQQATPALTLHNRSAACVHPEQLRIISFNVKGIPWPFQRKYTERLDQVCLFLRQQLDEVDVIVFQELFAHDFQTKIANVFSTASWNYMHLPSHRFPKMVGSGLGIATRLPVEQTTGGYFGGGSGSDAFAEKGWLRAVLEHSPGEFVSILNTHTQNPSEIRGKPVVRKQLDFLKTHLPSTDVLLGDLNVEPEDNPMLDTMIFSETIDRQYDFVVPRKPTFETGKYLDYACTHLQGVAVTMDDRVLSDHHPVLFQLEL